MLTFSEAVVTGEQSRVPNDYELGVMLRRDEPAAAAPSAWVEVYWHGTHVGRLERVDWLQLDPHEQFSTYWFRSLSGNTQVAGRAKADVLRRVEEVLTSFPNAVPAVAQ